MGDLAFTDKNIVIRDYSHKTKSPEVGHGVLQETAHDLVQDSGHDYAAIASQFNFGDEHSGLPMQMYPDVLQSDTISGAHMSADVSVVSEEHNSKHQSTIASHSHQFQDYELSESESPFQVDGGNDTDGEHNGQTGIGRSSVQGLNACAAAASQPFGPSTTSSPTPHSMNRVHQRLRSNSGQTWTESMNRAMYPTPTQPLPRPGCYSDGYSSQYYRTVPRYAYGYAEGMQPIWYDQSAMTAMDPGYFHKNTPQPQMPSHPFFQSGYVSQSPVSPGQYYGWPPWMSSYYPPPREYYPTSTPSHARHHYPSPCLHLPPPPPLPVFNPAYPAPALHRPPPMPLRRDGPVESKEVAQVNAPSSLNAQDKEKREKQFREAAREKLERDAEQEKKNQHKQKREKQFRDAVMERIQRIEKLEREAQVQAQEKAKKAEEEARVKAEKAEKEAKEKAEKEEKVAIEKAKILRAQARARAQREKEKIERAEMKEDEEEVKKKARKAAAAAKKAEKEKKAKERAKRKAEEEERAKKEKKSDGLEEFEAFVEEILRESRNGEWRPLVSHGLPEKTNPCSARELRDEDTLKTNVPESPVRISIQKASEKSKPAPVRELRYEDVLKSSAPEYENKLAHDIKKFVELGDSRKRTTGKLSILRQGSEAEYTRSRETDTVIGTGWAIKPKPVKTTFPEPKKTLEQRLEEANAWFHKDSREEPLFRRTVTALAKRHVTPGDEDDDKDEEEEERSSDETSAQNRREKEMIVLVGDAIASLGAYVSERDEKRSGYFSEFGSVHRRCCSTAVKSDGSVSYFERDPLEFRHGSVGNGTGVTSTGRFGRGTAGTIGTGTGTGTGSIGSSRGNQHCRSRANGEKKVVLIRPRRPEL